MPHRKSLNRAFRDLAILYGLPPFDGPDNFCLCDPYFAKSIESKYHATIPALRRRVGFQMKWMEWQHQPDPCKKRKVNYDRKLL